MRSIKRIVAIALTSFILLSTTIVANAETSQNIIQNSERKLEQKAELINEKVEEQQVILAELQNVQKDLQSIENKMTKNKEELAVIEQKISETQKKIEKMKEKIVVLEDKILARKGIMEERLISIHNNDQASLMIEILVDSENFTELIQRVTAVSTVLNADKDLLEQIQHDLMQIETEKAEIDQQDKILEEQNNLLATNQINLEQNLQKRQELLDSAKEKYDTISNEISIAEKDRQVIQEQLSQAQANLKSEQQEAVARAKKLVQPMNNSSASTKNSNKKTNHNKVTVSTKGNKELYVTATAYSHEDSTSGLTAVGHNIKQNPNMKLIAVDPSVIPLGSRVWVEGYGEAIAGDTGGAIKGHKIDVLMPSGAQARAWGRKTVKVILLK